MASGFGAGTALYGPDWLSASTTIKILLKISSYYKRRQMENGDREKERESAKKNKSRNKNNIFILEALGTSIMEISLPRYLFLPWRFFRENK